MASGNRIRSPQASTGAQTFCIRYHSTIEAYNNEPSHCQLAHAGGHDLTTVVIHTRLCSNGSLKIAMANFNPGHRWTDVVPFGTERAL